MFSRESFARRDQRPRQGRGLEAFPRDTVLDSANAEKSDPREVLL